MPLPDLIRLRRPVYLAQGPLAVRPLTRLPAGPAPVRDPHRRDRGAATVWAACAIAGLVVVAGLLWGLGSAAIARHRAAGAADLAALAAAGQAAEGSDVACGQALWVAERMGARVVSCRFEGWDALVEVVVDTGLGPAAGRARAGP
ncbi:Rv3654c family TadE-like protein [Amycolatopsis thermoflava]|uniref:Rv3654c family TadE-like protein n=1 Tax=Amycolatopsis thermoflava TaxID=84480 RepID=UPI00365636EF